jgi:hypothetical protein
LTHCTLNIDTHYITFVLAHRSPTSSVLHKAAVIRMAHAKRAAILLPADRKGFAIKSAHHFQVRRPKSAEAGAATKSAQNPDLMQRRRLDAACGVPDTEGALGRRLTTPASGLRLADPDA